ncbi:ABC transporter substrate-binding protein [Phytoactinopolyspora alkaliphila]|uniref:ABC transporter substrate-binding protein n=1 Tax=Phytoactinopolyspora alkaliphila TaxID=1783498 RepID=A0A6N9YGU3_9ACTN|nr:ABC transporter substrate-binding protein [Phytoactinopolyspora alkaliphila]NED94271.1 ABC transporter substrate-binding protein [Phytoactinopolyspora alkaliphila]
MTESRTKTWTRREMLRLGGGGTVLLTMSLAGCSASGGTAEDPPDDDAPVDPDRPLESPMLTEQVEAGELPPLEERLPIEADRLVVDGPDSLGVFGGTYNGAVLGQGDDPWLERMIGYEPMLRVDPQLEEIIPGIFKDIEVSDDGTEFTIHMRQGMRWSDGEPFTADDVMFAFENVYHNEEIHPTFPGTFAVDGDRATAERIDDHTVELTFPGPKGDFLDLASRAAQWWAHNLAFYPKHYLEQFLPENNPDLDAEAEAAGFGSWVDYWEDRIQWWNNPDKPVLFPWVITDTLNTGTRVVAERNPYYWKVDSGGAQLPYIDRLEFETVHEEEVMLLKGVNGELDFHSRHFNTDANKPVLAEGREEGDYDFVTVQTTSMNRMIISLNLNHKDDDLREIFQNRDFRIGLSHAIDRQDIIDTVYQRQGEPWQAAPHRESEFFDEEFAKQYTEYDVDLANQHLDAAGLTAKDGDGYRLRPDGNRLRFSLDVTTLFPEWANAADMVRRYWAEVGVDMQVNPIERTLFYERKDVAANEHDANVWAGDGGLKVEMLETRWWFPSGGEANYAMAWASYFDTRGEGEHAQEPPDYALRQMELAWQIPREPEPEVQKDLFREILQISKEQFYVIGIASAADGYAIAKNNLRNVVPSFPDSWLYLTPGPVDIPTWFFEN